MKEPSTLSEKAFRALQEAVAKVVDEHRRLGRPLAVWRDGKAVWLHLDPTGGVVNESASDSPKPR